MAVVAALSIKRVRNARPLWVPLGRAALGLFLLALWEFAAHTPGGIVASPLAILARIYEIAGSGKLARDALVTCWETVAGFAVGGGLGILLPILLWRSTRVINAIEPYIVTAIGVPKLAFAPILVLWFGISSGSKIVLVALMIFFMVFSMTLSGIRTLDVRLVAMLRVLGAGNADIRRELVVNSALPMILSALKIGLPRGFSAAIVAEYLGSTAGLGHAIVEAQAMADTVGIYAGIVTVTVIVLAVDRLLGLVQRRLLRWRPAAPIL
jgi:NitT/TauT family transport system permease protein